MVLLLLVLEEKTRVNGRFGTYIYTYTCICKSYTYSSTHALTFSMKKTHCPPTTTEILGSLAEDTAELNGTSPLNRQVGAFCDPNKHPGNIWVFPKITVSPKIIHSSRVFHYKPSILGYPYFWKHPFAVKRIGG